MTQHNEDNMSKQGDKTLHCLLAPENAEKLSTLLKCESRHYVLLGTAVLAAVAVTVFFFRLNHTAIGDVSEKQDKLFQQMQSIDKSQTKLTAEMDAHLAASKETWGEVKKSLGEIRDKLTAKATGKTPPQVAAVDAP